MSKKKPAKDPCVCDAVCARCGYPCFGGHTSGRHWCRCGLWKK